MCLAACPACAFLQGTLKGMGAFTISDHTDPSRQQRSPGRNPTGYCRSLLMLTSAGSGERRVVKDAKTIMDKKGDVGEDT
jgi:hypothetical protein